MYLQNPADPAVFKGGVQKGPKSSVGRDMPIKKNRKNWAFWPRWDTQTMTLGSPQNGYKSNKRINE